VLRRVTIAAICFFVVITCVTMLLLVVIIWVCIQA
jgi:hypothetical protein